MMPDCVLYRKNMIVSVLRLPHDDKIMMISLISRIVFCWCARWLCKNNRALKSRKLFIVNCLCKMAMPDDARLCIVSENMIVSVLREHQDDKII